MNINRGRRSLIILICFAITLPVVALIPPTLAFLNCGARLTLVNISGSTALYPLVNRAALSYISTSCSFIRIHVSPTSSQEGLVQVYQGSVDIGNSDLFADPNQQGLEDHQVAIVVFALVISKNNALRTITNLNVQQIQSIYGDAYHSWHDIDPAISDTALKIIIVSRPVTSGTRAAFGQYVLNGLESVSGTQVGESSEDVASVVCKTPGAIGYISLFYYYEHKDCLQLLSINGQTPTLAGVTDKQNPYTFWAIEHMYTRKQTDELTQKFIAYMYSDAVKAYIKQFDQFGYLDISDIPTDVLHTHLSL